MKYKWYYLKGRKIEKKKRMLFPKGVDMKKIICIALTAMALILTGSSGRDAFCAGHGGDGRGGGGYAGHGGGWHGGYGGHQSGYGSP